MSFADKRRRRGRGQRGFARHTAGRVDSFLVGAGDLALAGILLLCAPSSSAWAGRPTQAHVTEHKEQTSDAGQPAATDGPRYAQSYERWIPPAALDSYERELLGQVRQFAHRRQVALHYDWRLSRAAEALLPWARAHAGEPLPVDMLRQAAWAEGWTDGELAAVAITTHLAKLDRALREQLVALFAGGRALDQVAVAAEIEASLDDHALDRHTVVVVFSRRLLRLAPVRSRVHTGDQLLLSGRLTAKHAPRDLALSITCPDGRSHRAIVAAHEDGHFQHSLAVGGRAGTLEVQLSVDRGNGPEVATAFPVAVAATSQRAEKSAVTATATATATATTTTAATTPATATATVATTTTAPAAPNDPAAAATAAPSANTPPAASDHRALQHGSLLSLLYGLRGAHGLSLPVPTPSLMQVARQHADDMVAHHFFAHVSPHTGNVTHRLAAAHQPFLHVVENLAEGTGIDEMFAQWMHSPSHRLNLLDPRVEGVGLATAERPNGSQVAVLVMAAF